MNVTDRSRQPFGVALIGVVLALESRTVNR